MRMFFDGLVRLLDRLRFPGKFAVVAGVCVFGLVVLLLQIQRSHHEAVERTRLEHDGLGLLAQSFDLLVDVQLHRGLSFGSQLAAGAAQDAGFAAQLPAQRARVLAGLAAVDRSLEAETWAALRPQWVQRRALVDEAIAADRQGGTARAGFARHTEAVAGLLRWLGDIGDHARLSADPDPLLSRVATLLLRGLPVLVEATGDLRGYATGSFHARHDSVERPFALAARLAALKLATQSLDERLARLAGMNADILALDDPGLRALDARLRYLRNTALSSLYGRPEQFDPADFFTVGSEAIDGMAGLFHHRLKPAAETLLAQRLADSRRDFLGKLALSMAVFLLVALIFLAMYTSIRRSVAALGRSSQRFAAGDYSARVQIASQDEMAGLGRRFNQMADEIQTLIQDQHDSRLRLEGLLQNNPSVVFALDPATLRCRFVSPNVERLTGRAAATLAGRSLCWLDSVEPEDAEGLQAAMMNWQAGGFDGTLQHAYRLVCGTQQRWVEVQLGAVRTADDRVVEVVGSCTDITERQKAHTRLELAASVFSSAREGIIITDASGSILQVNDAFTQITGWSREEILGRNPRVLQSGHQGRAFYEAMWEALRQGGYWEGEIWNRRKTGEVYVQTLAIVAVRGRDAQVSHFVALFSDITLQKQHEQQLRKLAHFDPLTGLANRSLLADRLEQALVRSRRSGLQVAVVMIDLDGFKAVNDTHGHEAGDQLLKTLAARMQTCLREQDTLARLGGDEFVAVLCELEDAAAVQLPLQRLLAVIALPVALAEVTVQVSGSVGVSLYPQQAEVAAEVLMRQADQAMYVAKQEGKNRYRMFEPGRLLN